MQRAMLAGMGTLFLVLFALTLRDPSSLRYPLIYPQGLLVGVAALFYLLALRKGRTRGGPAADAHAADPHGSREAGGAAEAGEPTAAAGSPRQALLRFLATAVLAVVYVASWETAGYFLDTFLFTLILLIVLGERKLVFVAGLPALLTVVVYVVFFRLLYLPLPLGPFEGLLR